MPKEKNIQLVEELKEKIAKAQSIVFSDYLGLSSSDINKLRQKVKDTDGEMVVAKNTLLKIALDNESFNDDLKGPTAVVFSYKEPLATIKALFEFAKDLNLPKVKSALLDGVYTDSQKLEILSKLPSREQLLTQLLIGLKSPINNLSQILNGTQRKLVYTISAIAENKKEVS